MRVRDKVVLITGGGSGIGHASAIALAREGARVVVSDRDGEAAARVAVELGAPHVACTLDVTDEAGWAAIVDDVVASHGRLDVLVASAGVGVPGNIEQTSIADFRHMMAVNVEGVFLGARAAIGAMKRTGGGSIVNISSVAGLVGDPTPQEPNLVVRTSFDAAKEFLSMLACRELIRDQGSRLTSARDVRGASSWSTWSRRARISCRLVSKTRHRSRRSARADQYVTKAASP